MFNILFSLMMIFMLIPMLLILIVSKLNLKLSDKTVVFISAAILSIIVGILLVPLELNMDGELYGSYIFKIENYIIPLITHIESAMPLIHAISVFFYDLIQIKLDLYFNLLRMVLYFFYLYGIYLIFSLFKKNINEKYKYTFILLFFLISFDFNGTYLFTGDEFRNYLGQVFFIYFIYYYFFIKKIISFRSLIFIIAAMASHKLYIIFIPFFVLSHILYNNLRLYNHFKLTIILPLFMILLIPILQELSTYINFLSLADKLNHTVPIGIELILSLGVLGQFLFHISIIFFIIKAKKNILKNKDLMFIVFLTITMLVVARVNLFGIPFVGPSRIYGIMAPFIFILLTISLYHYMETNKNSIFPKIFISVYFLFSFSLINYAYQSYSPHILLLKQNIFSLDKYFGENLELIYYISTFFILLMMIDFIVNKILKMKKDILLLVWYYFAITSLILLITLLFNHDFDIYFYILFIIFIISFIMFKIFYSILPRKNQGNILNDI